MVDVAKIVFTMNLEFHTVNATRAIIFFGRIAIPLIIATRLMEDVSKSVFTMDQANLIANACQITGLIVIISHVLQSITVI